MHKDSPSPSAWPVQGVMGTAALFLPSSRLLNGNSISKRFCHTLRLQLSIESEVAWLPGGSLHAPTCAALAHTGSHL